MDIDPKTPAEDEAEDAKPIMPEIADGKKAAEAVEEKGEPFDSNFA